MPPKKSTSKGKRKSTSDGTAAVKKKIPKADDNEVLGFILPVKRAGHVLTLGTGDVGQLGLGEDIMERKRPAPIKEVDGIKFAQVTCGGMHSVALTEDGEVYTWGCNDDGALGRTTADGEEFLPGKVTLPDELKVVQVSAGDSHTASVTSEGEVYAWGAYRDASGQIGLTAAALGKKGEVTKIYPKPGSENIDPAIKVVSGNDHTVILTKKGDIYTNGTGEQGQLGRIKECFGHRGGRRGLDFILLPQLVRLRKKVKFADVFAGSFCTYALSRDTNEVYAWGLNNYGQLGSGSTDSYFNPEVIKPLSEIREASSNSNFKIEGGQHHTILCDGSGAVYSIGRSEYGRLGLGEGVEETPLPVRITGLKDKKVTSIACGEAVSFAITEEGHLFSWGLGTSLQLGAGDEEDLFTPTLVKSKYVNIEEDEILSVSAGGQHTALLTTKRSQCNGITDHEA